jgi:serine O-acetyltransferase
VSPMFGNLLADLQQKAVIYELPQTRGTLLRMLVNDGSAAQIMYRTMRFCQTHHMTLLAAVVYRLNAAITHATIGRNADIAPGFVILHSVGVVINTNVRAGRNLVLYHGVTLGAERNKSPILGDNVYIGAGAKVIGGVRIGSDVKIGANAVVTKDVPDGATVIGIPARIIRMRGVPVAPQDDT